MTAAQASTATFSCTCGWTGEDTEAHPLAQGCPDCGGFMSLTSRNPAALTKLSNLTAHDLDEIASCLDSGLDLAHPLAVNLARAHRASEDARATDRAAMQALVDALPRCSHKGCAAIATLEAQRYPHPGFCEAHRPEKARDLDYGAELRAVIARLGAT